MKHYRVRLATVRDVPTLARQRHSMFVDMHEGSRSDLAAHDRAFPGWARRQLRAGRLRCYLVEDPDGRVVGGGSIWLRDVQPFPGFRGGKVPYLMSMYTAPNQRRKGVATMIIREAIAWSSDHGYGSLTLHASKVGRPLYESLGWKDSSEMELDLSEPARRRRQRTRLAPRRSDR